MTSTPPLPAEADAAVADKEGSPSSPSGADCDEDEFDKCVRTGGDDGEPMQELADALAVVNDQNSDQSNAELITALQQVIIGKAFLHWAVQCGQPLSVLAAAIKLGADVTQRDAAGSSILHLAVLKNAAETIRFLARKGADVEWADGRGMTPLHWAVQRGYAQSTRALVEMGADINKADAKGFTPLLCAAARPDSATMIALVVELGADLNALDKNGVTPVIWCINEGKLEAARALVKAGASVDRPDRHGSTPLHCAARRDNGGPYLVALLEMGAQVHQRDEHGMTALEWADLKGQMTQELREAFSAAAQRYTTPPPS